MTIGELSATDIEALLDDRLVQRRTTVMFLRNGGATWSQIAAAVEVSIATCRKDYGLVCRDINGEDRTHTVARHRATVFDICRANYKPMMRGEKDAAMVILKALEREAKLLGLDQPMRVLAAVSTEDYANEAAKLIDFIQHNDADTLQELTRGRDRNTVVDGTLEDTVAVVDATTGDQDAGVSSIDTRPQAFTQGAVEVDAILDEDWSNIGD